jgi:hypothetical protein
VEIEGFLGYALLFILVAKDGDTMYTSFSNSVNSTVVLFDNKVELEAIDPGM